jgi:hypothetical protein
MLPKNGALRLFASLKPYVAYVLGCGLLLVLGLGLHPFLLKLRAATSVSSTILIIFLILIMTVFLTTWLVTLLEKFYHQSRRVVQEKGKLRLTIPPVTQEIVLGSALRMEMFFDLQVRWGSRIVACCVVTDEHENLLFYSTDEGYDKVIMELRSFIQHNSGARSITTEKPQQKGLNCAKFAQVPRYLLRLLKADAIPLSEKLYVVVPSLILVGLALFLLASFNSALAPRLYGYMMAELCLMGSGLSSLWIFGFCDRQRGRWLGDLLWNEQKYPLSELLGLYVRHISSGTVPSAALLKGILHRLERKEKTGSTALDTRTQALWVQCLSQGFVMKKTPSWRGQFIRRLRLSKAILLDSYAEQQFDLYSQMHLQLVRASVSCNLLSALPILRELVAGGKWVSFLLRSDVEKHRRMGREILEEAARCLHLLEAQAKKEKSREQLLRSACDGDIEPDKLLRSSHPSELNEP